MDPVLKTILTVIGAILAVAGLVVVYAAPRIVDRQGLAEKKQVDPRLVENMSPEEIEKYRRDMAALDIKLRGLLLALPGFVIILIVLR